MSILHAARAAITAVGLAAIAALATAEPVAIEQSPNDERHYRALELENGLTVLLIEDEQADMAAASLSVFRGSHEDPDERPGLAHFVEHMLFLGTEKYPDVDEYSRYISTHGGSRNAYVASDHTNYFFDIKPEHFEGALDRLAQFFIAPSFDVDYVEREKQAVHSEYQMQLRNDAWRGFAVSKAVMNPDHPGSRFTIGSLETLEGTSREELLEFYEAHYSADEMALVVLGNQRLDTLEGWVRERFSEIPARETVPPAELPRAFDSDALPKRLVYRTRSDSEHIAFSFPLPSTDAYYDRQPLRYIANLLGHEGEGSLHELLTERGWIESLSASRQRMDSENAMLTVRMRLTSEGTQRTGEITRALFAYIELIREGGLEEWRYDEQARIAELDFRFQERRSPRQTVSSLAPRFRLYATEHVLVAPYLMREYDEALLRRFLDELRPENVLIRRSGPALETDREERWFEVPYSVEPLSVREVVPANAQRANEELATLALAEPNPFLPEDLAVIEEEDAVPGKLVDEEGLELWLARDGSFDVPRASSFVKLGIDQGAFSPEDVVHANIFARLVRHELNSYAYPARLAGIDYDISHHHAGFRLSITGFSDKQALLAERLLEVIATLEPDAERIALYRDELRRSWRNFRTERAYVQSHAGISHLLLAGSWSPLTLADRVEEVTAASLRRWIEERLGQVRVTALLHGNFDHERAREFAERLREGLPLAELAPPEREVLALEGRGAVNYGHETEEDDATLAIYVQAGDDSLEQRALHGLTAQVLRNPYFTELRTRRQLGYVVFATPTVLHRRGGLSFVVQSPVAGADALYDTTRSFLTGYRERLAAMDDDELDAHKQGLINQLLERDANLGERSRRFWRDLELGFIDFDSRERIAAHVDAIERAELLKFYDALLAKLEEERLIVFSSGRFEDAAPPGRLIERPEAFRKAEEPVETAAMRRAANGHSAE